VCRFEAEVKRVPTKFQKSRYATHQALAKAERLASETPNVMATEIDAQIMGEDSEMQRLARADYMRDFRVRFSSEASCYQSAVISAEVKLSETINLMRGAQRPHALTTAVACTMMEKVVSVSGLLGHALRTILDEVYRALYINYEDINGDQFEAGVPFFTEAPTRADTHSHSRTSSHTHAHTRARAHALSRRCGGWRTRMPRSSCGARSWPQTSKACRPHTTTRR
jgi:hypothetical protein